MTDELPDAGGADPELSNELQQFATDLSRLRPRDDRLDRERLAFLAGQASVAPVPSNGANILGLRRESRGWPAAFIAMTAIAATLLCMLLTRPVVPGAASIGTNTPVQNGTQFFGERVGGGAVLTTRDIRLAAIDTRLATFDADKTGADTSPSPVDDLTHRIYTPAAWQRVISETESAKPLPRKSSDLSPNRGVNT